MFLYGAETSLSRQHRLFEHKRSRSVSDLPDSRRVVIVTGLVSIVERLDLKVIAKGVETREQREFPGELDCENAGLYHPDDGKSVLDAAPGLQPNPGSAAAGHTSS